MEKNPTQQPKILLISPIRKIPTNRFKSFAVKSFISSPIKHQFSSNYPMQSSFVVAVVSAVVSVVAAFLLDHFLNFKLYAHTCHANLTNQCLLNVAFSMTKALND